MDAIERPERALGRVENSDPHDSADSANTTTQVALKDEEILTVLVQRTVASLIERVAPQVISSKDARPDAAASTEGGPDDPVASLKGTTGNDRDSNESSENPVGLIQPVARKVEYYNESGLFIVDEALGKDLTVDAYLRGRDKARGSVLEFVTTLITNDAVYSSTNGVVSSTQTTHKLPSIRSIGESRLRINSVAILDALRSVVHYYPGLDLRGSSTELPHPYSLLFWHQKQLEDYRQAFSPDRGDVESCHRGENTYEHLGLLLECLENELGESVREERARHKRDVPVATFEMLWLLFQPGTDVYCDRYKDGVTDSYVVSGMTVDKKGDHALKYTIHMWNLRFDSYQIGPNIVGMTIDPFDGEKEIGKLEVFPAEYATTEINGASAASMRQELEDRGRMYYHLTVPRCMFFDGLTTSFPKRKYTSLAVVDPETYAREVRANRLSSERCVSLDKKTSGPSFLDYNRISVQDQKGLSDHQYFLCDRAVLAFVLKVRSWQSLDIRFISDAKYNPDLFQSLVVPDETRTLLQALARQFLAGDTDEASQARNPWSADFVEGKGEGSIVLLHGGPGTGKTFTAECLAEYTKRPLLSLTSTDVGTEPEAVEESLRGWFKKAKLWGAIMLLDEADIYLEERIAQDIKRNSLVAAFLRAMEYYQGLLIITTNRIGTFDEAFVSRIPVIIHYPPLSEQTREEIWQGFFEKLEREREKTMRIQYSTKEYINEAKAVKAVSWNGREIRNAFQTAVALAEVDGHKDQEGRVLLKPSHIETIVKLSSKFKDYIATVHKADLAKRARIARIRNDDFTD
ncbi:MAG: hypothetical protein M1821_006058 [Bathelium mastoideum]|nr:MAG: hypothetical protein M1821_006058 [Bathelium mastoideum]